MQQYNNIYIKTYKNLKALYAVWKDTYQIPDGNCRGLELGILVKANFSFLDKVYILWQCIIVDNSFYTGHGVCYTILKRRILIWNMMLYKNNRFELSYILLHLMTLMILCFFDFAYISLFNIS